MSLRNALRGVQFEIVSSLFLVMLTGLGIVAVLMTSLAARTTERAALGELRTNARHFEQLFVVGKLRLPDLAVLARTSRSVADWSIHDARGRELGPGRGTVPEALPPLFALARRSGEVLESGGWLLGDLVYVTPLRASGRVVGFMVGTVPRARLAAELELVLRSGGFVLGAAALVFLVFGSYLLRRRIVAPLRALTAATRRVAAGDLATRTEALGGDELVELGRNFNEMACSLERDRVALLRATDSLARSQRLASVGQLAAGMAHEVGNPVAAILGHAEVVLRDRELSERTRASAECVRDEALRVRSLVRDLLDHAHSDQLRLEPVDAPALLDKVCARMSRQKLLDDISLVCEASLSASVETDRLRVEQILVNLIENAAQALVADGAVGAPRISLEARAAMLPCAREHRRADDVPEADFSASRGPDALEFRIRDNGPGIDPERLPHIFDPFYTTKEPGQGTGLGLWNAHRLAELLGGRLDVESRPGETTFSLLLPLADRPRDGAATGPDR